MIAPVSHGRETHRQTINVSLKAIAPPLGAFLRDR